MFLLLSWCGYRTISKGVVDFFVEIEDGNAGGHVERTIQARCSELYLYVLCFGRLNYLRFLVARWLRTVSTVVNTSSQ